LLLPFGARCPRRSRRYAFAPPIDESLTLSQIADIESILANHTSPSVTRSLSIIEIALRRDYHQDLVSFRELTATAQEASAAAAAIIELAGC
jgi:hypothetical protein